MSSVDRQAFYKFGLWYFAIFTLLHVLAIPVVFSYDSHDYVRLAGQVLTNKFPADLFPQYRTPGFPLLIQLSFELLGRQPLALIFANTFIASLGIYAVGRYVLRVAGPVNAGLALVVVSTYPLLVAYEHIVLTEAGTFAYMAMIMAVLLGKPTMPRQFLIQALALGLLLTAGYYHRQTLIQLAPVVALLFGAHLYSNLKSSGSITRKNKVLVAGLMLLIIIIPQGLASFWKPYSGDAILRNLILKLGIVRQIVIPPEDPIWGDKIEAYRQAIEDTETGKDGLRGNMYSGLRMDRLHEFTGYLQSKPGTIYEGQSDMTTIAKMAWQYPGRYLMAVIRSMMMFCGFPSYQSTTISSEMSVFFILDKGENLIGDGPADIQDTYKAEFRQKTAVNPISEMLRLLHHPYRLLVIISMLAMFVQLVAGLWLRNLNLLTVTTIPLVFIVCHAIILASEDRYSSPIWPLVIANLLAMPVMLRRAWMTRKV